MITSLYRENFRSIGQRVSCKNLPSCAVSSLSSRFIFSRMPRVFDQRKPQRFLISLMYLQFKSFISNHAFLLQSLKKIKRQDRKGQEVAKIVIISFLEMSESMDGNFRHLSACLYFQLFVNFQMIMFYVYPSCI